MPKKKEKEQAKSLIFFLLCNLFHSARSTSLMVSLEKQVWFPDTIYSRLAFHS